MDGRRHKSAPDFLKSRSNMVVVQGILVRMWAEGPSILFVFGLLYAAFKRVIWKATLLHKLGVVKTPVLNGRWTGFVVSSHDGHKERREVTAHITQNWTDIAVKV